MRKIFVFAFIFILLAPIVLSANSENSDNIKFYVSMGNFLAKNNYEKESVYFYEKAVELDGKNTAVLNNLAVVYHDLGNYDLAIEKLQKLVEINPKNAQYHYDLAINYADNFRYNKKGNLDVAIQEFKNADSLSPGYEYSRQNIFALEKIKSLN